MPVQTAQPQAPNQYVANPAPVQPAPNQMPSQNNLTPAQELELLQSQLNNGSISTEEFRSRSSEIISRM